MRPDKGDGGEAFRGKAPSPAASWLSPGGRGPVFRWVLVGGLFMGLNIGFLYLLVGRLGLSVVVATLLSAEASTVLRFLVNDRWVFGNPGPTWTRLWQYHAANAGAFAIWWTATNVMNRMGFHYLVASILAVGFSTGVSLFSNFFWIWRKQHHPPSPS
jgi:putative flippase GtrA